MRGHDNEITILLIGNAEYEGFDAVSEDGKLVVDEEASRKEE